MDFALIKPFKVYKMINFKEFRQTVAQTTGIPPQCQRFWTWVTRLNKTYRPDIAVITEKEGEPVIHYKSKFLVMEFGCFTRTKKEKDNDRSIFRSDNSTSWFRSVP